MTRRVDSSVGKVAANAMRAGIFAGLALVSAGAMAGCSAEPAQGPVGVDAPVAAPEGVAVVKSDLGEVRCAEQACTAANSCQTIFVPDVRCNGGTATVSDAVPYGTFGCPQASTVVVTARAGSTVFPLIQWGDQPLTVDNCASAKLDLTVHTRASSSVAWTSTIHRYHGEWQAGSGFLAPLCQFVLNDGYSDPDGIVMTSTNQVTLAGSAKVGSTGYRTVVLGAQTFEPPC